MAQDIYNDNNETIKTIERNSVIPYYYQLKKILLSKIDNGIWEPNNKIPSEAKLCEKYDISRTVVRQALMELANEGHLYKEKARGVFVAGPKITNEMIRTISGFYEVMTSKGYDVKTKVLEIIKTKVNKKVADYLKIKTGEPAIKITRVRSVNNEKIVIVSSYINSKICPGLINEDLENKSLYKVLKENYKLEIVGGRRLVGATIASDLEASMLNIRKGAPLITLESINYLKDGRILEYFSALYRGDRTVLETGLIKYGLKEESN